MSAHRSTPLLLGILAVSPAALEARTAPPVAGLTEAGGNAFLDGTCGRALGRYFIENRGQVDPRACVYLQGRTAWYFTGAA